MGKAHAVKCCYRAKLKNHVISVRKKRKEKKKEKKRGGGGGAGGDYDLYVGSSVRWPGTDHHI